MQIFVIGLGRFGYRVAQDLASRGAEVIAADDDPKAVDSIKEKVTVAVCLDGTDEKAMRKVGAQDVDVAVVAIGKNIEAAIMATAVLRRLGIPQIISRAMTPLQAEILHEVGAKRVILLEDRMGEQVAREIMEPHVKERISLASGHHVFEVKVPAAFAGRTLKELDLRGKLGVNVIAIQSQVETVDSDGKVAFERRINDLPGPNDTLQDEDILVVVGGEKELLRLSQGEIDLPPAEGEKK